MRPPAGRHRAPRWSAPVRAAITGAVAVAMTVGTAACGSDGAGGGGRPEVEARPITAEEAASLADVLTMNLDAGGSAFRATAPFGLATFGIDGEIDWTNHIGAATVSPEIDGSEPPEPFDVRFDRSIVFEEVPGLAAALESEGRPPAAWIARPLDPESSPLDLILTLIDATASSQRDNPVLLQSNGTEWVGTGDVDGAPADIFDLGRTRYWVDTETGRLVRSEADLEMTGSVVTIDWRDPGPRTVAVPDAADIVDVSTVADLYAELRATGG